MANLQDPYEQTVIDRGFVAHAVDAGIVTTIQSLISGQGISKLSLLSNLKDALMNDNEALANSLALDNLQLILDYMGRIGVAPVVIPADAPELIDEDGPAGTWASDAGSNQINVTFSEPTTAQTDPGGVFETYTYEIYANGVFQKSGSIAPVSGNINDSFVLVGGDTVNVRVAFVDGSTPAQMSRLGPTATVNR